ncbi:twitching motility protein PilJ [Sphaerotilus hippei]|uniref:Twitching motility protein PilJ n=1 Tax=Sphaerotilus hippei TaxID=744406 RepID=A0A318GWC0_9BURK|nr:methyl-accepting chemotaxis protein [Sphaerotilus hippei]PXW93854.1 twitching motility protein PilJ [Sphaerotilus hippei]
MSLIDKFKGKGQQQDKAAGTDPAIYGSAYLSLDMNLDAPDTVQDPSDRTTVAPEPGSIISEAAPSELATGYHPTRLPVHDRPALPRPGSGARLPLIGHLSADRQQRVLGVILAVGVLGLVLSSVLAVRSAGGSASQVGATGQALMQSQRLSKSVLQAMVGQEPAFAEVRESAQVLARNVRGLHAGDAGAGIDAAPLPVRGQLEVLLPLVDQAEKQARVVLERQRLLTRAGEFLRAISQQSGALLESTQAVLAQKVQQGAAAAEISAAGQLMMLTQRVGKSANEVLSIQGVSPEAVFLLGKDLSALRDVAQGLLDGDAARRLGASRDPVTRERLEQVIRTQDGLREQAAAVQDSLQGLVAARDAEVAILGGSEKLRQGLEGVQASLSAAGGIGWFNVALLAASLLVGAIGAFGLLRVFTHDQRQRALLADIQRQEAERQEREAKRVNDANQAAILRLMNELQSVAEGDLTQQATVTEDITGAIADSVNYTVEELRSLVAQVQGTVARVADTTQQVEATSTELLAASDEQLREIRDTGEAVLQMAGRIQRVSGQSQQSAAVARESLSAAASGLTAVLDTIGGMNTIREQIQETSKRIKRLGESSQEIGEITELISDITEQTNVLALNAAIQAASAGEAGRGFSVVAEEVQRLAERSGDATRQIAVLVKTIQTDTADAVAAMERSTQGVVEGAKLSDNAGTALGEIDRVSRQLAELIEAISTQARREADSATVVSQNIQHIFAVTEQTGEGTRSTAQLVRQLSRTAEELRQSVARFKIT